MRAFLSVIGAGISLASGYVYGADSAAIEKLVAATVTAEVEKRYTDSTYTVEALPLAAAARLKPCDRLLAEVQGKNLYGRVPVRVRCETPAPWSLYATALVTVEVSVLVTRHALARGERITADVLDYQTMDLHKLRSQTVTDKDDAVGKVTRRALSARQPITLQQLSTPPTVTKGERVKIQAYSGRVRIHSFGVALENGHLGEQIEVRHATSKRVIQPWVSGPGIVATSPPVRLVRP